MIRRSLSLSAIALILQVGGSHAASLDKETCDKLKGEQTELEGTGARANMVKGPEWAKANLAPDKLGQIKRLIEVEELLLFRCQGRPLVVLPPEPETDPAKTDDKDDDKAPPAKDAKAAEKGAPAAGKAAAQPAKAAVSGTAKAAAGDAKPKPAPAGAAAKKADPPAPAKAAKAKPKADDAYKPPAGKN
jgi:hypothetical protein